MDAAMITPVTDGLLTEMTEHGKCLADNATMDIDAVEAREIVAELRALRALAAAAERLLTGWDDGRSPGANLMPILAALRDAGRLG